MQVQFSIRYFSLLLLSTTAFSQITAAVAANVQFAMEELKKEFQKEAGAEVKSVYGSSGKLAAQIKNGAPFDVFVSADMDFPDSLHRWGHASARPHPYAYGKLVLWTIKNLNLGKGLGVLDDAAVGRIAVADPQIAPYGREALAAFRRAGIYEKIQGKLVFGESISQVSQYILSGNVDAGLSAQSVVLAKEVSGKGNWAIIDSTLYRPIPQGALVTRYGSKNNPGLSQRFLDFLHSEPARIILARYGYSLP